MQTDILKNIISEVSEGRSAALVFLTESKGSVPGAENSTMAVLEDGNTFGTIGGGPVEYEVIKKSIQAIKNGEDSSFDHNLSPNSDIKMLCGGNSKGYIKVFKPNPQLLIFGAGHVGQKLARIAAKTNFDVTVIDKRENYREKEDLKDIKNFIFSETKDAVEKLSFNKNETYIVICTPNYDQEVLENIIEKDYKFLGMIGSKRKVKTVYDSMKNKGFDEKLFDKVHAPVGLDIDDGTVEEIAISILSLILSIKNNKEI